MRLRRMAAVLLAVCVPAVGIGAADIAPSQWQLDAKHSQAPASLKLTLRAKHDVRGWLSAAWPVLTIECSGGRATSFVEAGVALEVTQVDQQVVRVRFDDAPFHPERWREVGNWTMSPRHPDRLIGQLLRSRSFTLEFTPFSSAPVQAEFAVQDLAQYAGPLATACGLQALANGATSRGDE